MYSPDKIPWLTRETLWLVLDGHEHLVLNTQFAGIMTEEFDYDFDPILGGND